MLVGYLLYKTSAGKEGSQQYSSTDCGVLDQHWDAFPVVHWTAVLGTRS